MTRIPSYGLLAQYYDAIFSPARAPMEAARERLLRDVLPRVETACDLACGTGSTAVELARRGLRTYAVDLSASMCRIAREKAARARLPVRVLRADMRDFRLPEPVDLVTCELDALNHVPRKSGLPQVARAVARALRPGGYFYFDVNNALGFERYWTGNVWIERPGIVLVMRNGHAPRASRAWSDIEWFVRRGSVWLRHRERVEEVCWTPAEIGRALRQAGFGRVRSWDAAPFFRREYPIGSGCRTVYLAQKAGK